MVGGHYTYAEVPIGELFHKNVFSSKAWMNFFIVSMCLGISTFYELLEWWVALLSGEAAEAFLGTQGYVWDTQSDMGLVIAGAIVALVLLSGAHDRQLSGLKVAATE